MKRFFPVALLIGLLVAFRLIGLAMPDTIPMNFQPLAAIFFCGALIATGWRGFLIPLAAWVLSYPPSQSLGEPAVFVTTLGAFGLVFLMGSRFVKAGVSTLLLGSLASALLFHTLTGGAAWMFGGLYPKTVEGLWQSLWSGPAGASIPSWAFLRNMAVANLLFTAIFVLARFKWTVPNAVLAQPRPAMAKSR
ncbi:MAG: hypothetical protein KDN05_06425 [Verrucomicrobiae bacterium]|nr:hypothetical protein [Verrucomicrobiae bacterium]MCP5532641.1 hypothetical protein [Akkermansiaceae bacterium]MCP5544123.1 hypothetical protein [Akkermansiaceae bacterium]MCP5547821.1 hypothetical protein [Akkermansiaceae bacterium]